MYEADFSNPLEKNMGYGSSVFTFYSNSFLKTRKNRSEKIGPNGKQCSIVAGLSLFILQLCQLCPSIT